MPMNVLGVPPAFAPTRGTRHDSTRALEIGDHPDVRAGRHPGRRRLYLRPRKGEEHRLCEGRGRALSAGGIAAELGDIPLVWLANHGNYDVFGIGDGFVTEEFVVRASVDGRSEWDNKDGANYQVANFHNVVVGNVVLGKAAAELGLQGGGDFVVQTSWLEGEIYVDNLCYVKRVGLWYTAGGGATRPVLHAIPHRERKRQGLGRGHHRHGAPTRSPGHRRGGGDGRAARVAGLVRL